MFLGPHHFQQSDRYYEGLVNSRLKSIMPLYWGLVDLEVDPEALENGSFALLSCHGVLPGGTYIDIPQTDQAPEIRAIEEHFDPSMEALDVYLAVPAERSGAANYRLEDTGGLGEARYFREYINVVDENTGDNEQEIPVARKNLRILFQDESLDAHDCLKIAELERTRENTFASRESYIPPCISISASPRLVRIARRLTELLVARSNEIRGESRERADGSGAYEFGSADLTNLWILNTVNSFIPELSHYYNTMRIHPEELFRVLVRLAGALTVFSVNIAPMRLPGYDHEDLSRCFAELDARIRELLEILGPTAAKCVFISLEEIAELTYKGTIEDYLLAPEYKFYLGVRGQADQEDIIYDMEHRVKIASTSEISFLVGKAVRGIRLSYLRSAPSDIPVKAGYSYFALDPESDFWEDVQQTGDIAIFLPPDAPSSRGIQMELMALEEGE